MTGLRAELQHARTLAVTHSHGHMCTCPPSPRGARPSCFRHQETLQTPHLPTLASVPGSRQNPEGNTPRSPDRNRLPTPALDAAPVVSGVCLPGLCQCRKRVSHGSDPETRAAHSGAAPPSLSSSLPLGQSSVHLKSLLSGSALPQPTQASCPCLFSLHPSAPQYFWSRWVGPVSCVSSQGVLSPSCC